MDVGKELRQARLARGLTLEQVSVATRLTYALLYAIEHNNVGGMPLDYVRAYVHDFAHQVGLDPDNLSKRYIAQFEITTVPPAPTEPFDLEIAGHSDAETTPDYALRSDADLARPPHSELPSRSGWGARTTQLAVLVLVAVISAQTGFMVGWNRAHQQADVVDDARITAISVDAERSSAPAEPDPALPEPDPDAGRVSEVVPAISATTGATDLSGEWTMTNEVQTSGLQAFRGLQLVYELELHQNGDKVSGTGRKISENGKSLQGAARTPITLSGTVDDDRVHLTFRETGRRRESGGSFQFQLSDDGSLRGTFESDAAQSSGQSVVRRALP
jgi:cytoskeletal protein RodZ